ncbi:MAG: hypothetical protein KA515_01845, partial [Candidatus Pacebacteria bacterium]|nr:hypothetical protein [Candidatus Paceibacterota bacterium]
MIYLFAGDDTKKKRLTYEKFLKTIDGVETLFINKNNFNKTQIESLYSGAGLFSPKFVVVFEGILEYEDHRDFILDKLPLLASSQNDYIFLEGKLLKPILDDFRKARAELNIFELPKEKKEKFDNF